MDGEAFAPGTPEAEVDRVSGGTVEAGGGRGRRGDITLTNDRILFATGTGSPATGNLIGDLAAAALDHKLSGDDGVLLQLSEVVGGHPHRRRLLPDLFEFAQADGHTVRLPMKHGRRWSPLIRRLVAERHGLAVADDGPDAWRVRRHP